MLFASLVAKAQIGQTLHFDGINDYVNSGDITATNFGAGDFSIEFWLNSTQTPMNDAAPIIAKRGICGCSNFWNILLINGGEILYEESEAGCLNYSFTVSNIIVNDGMWHHIAVIRNGNTVFIYIDGILDAANNVPIANLSNLNAVQIARSPCVNFPTQQYLNGSIDELRIWNYAKTEAEILAQRDVALCGDESGLIAYYDFNQGIANDNNPTETTLIDRTDNGNDGTLINFALMGTESNWTAPSVLLTNCSEVIIPTMSQWALWLFGLIIATLGITTLYNLQIRREKTN